MQQLLFSFRGRANRAKWWLVNLGIGIVYIIALCLIARSAAMSPNFETVMSSIDELGGIVLLALGILMLWVGLAVAAKRWHDHGKSAWWILIAAVPVIGSLWFFIECGFLKGTKGINRYGRNPLASL